MSNGEIATYRRRLRISQVAVARELNISDAAYNRFERGHASLPWKIPPSDALEAIDRIKARREAGEAGQ